MMANLLYWFDWKLPGYDDGAILAKELDLSEVYGFTVQENSSSCCTDPYYP